MSSSLKREVLYGLFGKKQKYKRLALSPIRYAGEKTQTLPRAVR